MSATTYPVRVDARRDSSLSRWLWLVKWFLAIPHYIILGFLWLAFVVLSATAFFAILFTGRYPRSIFDFNVGVLRWTWRVQYYAYGGWEGLSAAAVGRVRVRVSAGQPSRTVFVGLARAADVTRYLSGVRYATLTNIGGSATAFDHAGTAVPASPAAEAFWVARASGTGRQTMTWTPRAGNWMVVVLNADASPGVSVRADVGATLPALWWLVAGLLVGGLALAGGGAALIVVAARRASSKPTVTDR